MLRNYVKTTWRSLRKHAVYAVINVVGLTIGLTGSLVIYNVLSYETNFDGFHTDANRIYRVVQNNHTADGIQYWNTTAYTLASALRSDFSNIEVAQTAGPVQRIISTKGNDEVKRFEVKNILFSDSHYLKMFDFKEAFNNGDPYWLQGSNESAFDLPNSVVLTRNIANLYFHQALERGESLLGKSLLLNNKDELIVTGVVENPPANTNLLFDMLITYEFFKKHNPYPTGNWSGNYQGSTYVKLPINYEAQTLIAQFPEFEKKYMNEQDQQRIAYDLKPLAELHNDAKYGASIGSYIVSRQMLVGLSIMGVFLLIIAIVNYVNLATAQASKRAREVGIRKVLGSSRLALIKQFFFETLLLTIIAAIHSYAITNLILGQLNTTLTIIHFDVRMGSGTLWFLTAIVILVTVLASFYPSLSISGQNPVKALKSKISGNTMRDGVLRNALVVVQFAIVQLLIVGTFVVRNQMEYFKNKDLGFDSDAVAVVNVPDRNIESITSFQQKLLQYSNIEKVSFSSGIPTEPTIQYGTTFRFSHEPEEMQRETEMKVIDLEYLNMYGIEIIAGKELTEGNVMEQGFNGFLVNETLVNMLNTSNEEIIGQQLQINEGKATVIGVVKDFNNQALHENITPCVLFNWGTGFYGEAGIKIASTANTKETLEHVEKVWNETFTDKIYRYEFIDDYLSRSYQVEQMVSSAFQIATILAIIIGCLGLYGLISFITESKTKEIGIRRVLGAGMVTIINNLSRELLMLVLISIVVGSLLGWYIMGLWLENFNYKVEIGASIFLTSAFSTVIVALLATSFKTIKAAAANPVDSLRYE